MGFASLVMYIIMFLVVMMVFFGIANMYQGSLSTGKDVLEEGLYLKSDIEIKNVSYSAGTITAWAKNKGQEPITIDDIDIYLAGEFIPRDFENKSFSINDVKNPGLWDPGELMMTDINMTLAIGLHDFRITSPGSNANTSFVVGTLQNETLAMTAGQWSPGIGGTALEAGELLAVNNLLGTNLSLNLSSNSSLGLEVENTPAVEVTSTSIIIDYKGSELSVAGRYQTYDGAILCSDIFGVVSGLSTIILDCPGLDSDELQNLYILLNNTGSDHTYVDYVRVNASYIS